MKICVAQLRPRKGDMPKNIAAHIQLIDLAIDREADMIVFPELSLTGYEPELSKYLALKPQDSYQRIFQQISNESRITIGVGMPILQDSDVLISMIIYQAKKPVQIYSKQYLHADEVPYFIPGQGQVLLKNHKHTVAPAICYESLLHEHAANAVAMGANIYLASVAKSSGGLTKAFAHYPEIAKKYGITVLMANCLGFCDNFDSVGQSSIWNSEGILVGQLDDSNEGVLIWDTDTQEVLTAMV